MKRITLITTLVVALAGLAAGIAPAQDDPDPAAASDALVGSAAVTPPAPGDTDQVVETKGLVFPMNHEFGCWFNASNPYVSSGRIWTKLQIRCDSGRYLYWHARLTKDVSGPDQTAGSSDGYDYFPSGKLITWYLSNNRDACPGSGSFFGKLSIQTSSLGTAYSDRSANVYVQSC